MNLVRRAYCSDARQPENCIKLIFISYKTKMSSEPEISQRLDKDNSKSLNNSNLFFIQNKQLLFFGKIEYLKFRQKCGKKTFFPKLLLKHHACTRYCSQSPKYEIMVFLILKFIRTRDIPIILDSANITLVAHQPQPKPQSYPSWSENLEHITFDYWNEYGESRVL